MGTTTTQSARVLVGMSGGVDSSVSAALLKEQGYAVEGAFIVPWSPPWLPCTWRDERLDALRVAESLHIPFHTVDLSVEYERDVVQYMVREYQAGRTPNPDVMCNRCVKFGAFFDWALDRGFEYVATGHYARVSSDSPLVTRDSQLDTRYSLLAGVDTNKDQSYFLWTLTQRHLGHVLFPVGGYEKSYVRTCAETYSLPTARKKDSQGICFLGQVDMKEFLRHYIPSCQGDVLDRNGVVIGTHDGAAFITLGQRHGFSVAHTGSSDPPLYVVSKNIQLNTITVAPRNDFDAVNTDAQRHVRLSDLNWMSGAKATEVSNYRCLARFRYRQPLVPVTVACAQGDSAEITFDTPQEYVALGQSLVLYEGSVCLGGGIINRVY
ncbi:MAG: tRNA 2-thiouridine(34) synthase MnmA [Candidatus Pacebacteria bacterium]|nr:tRNA 2-thiouridine(34) synthase MnmA [Candidatus Paceibacterota bacterium]